jgi:hypothetical protein
MGDGRVLPFQQIGDPRPITFLEVTASARIDVSDGDFHPGAVAGVTENRSNGALRGRSAGR